MATYTTTMSRTSAAIRDVALFQLLADESEQDEEERLLISRLLVLSTALLICVPTSAQKPVYLCNGVYTDNPCKDGKEVDIAPTRGVHSMSGQKRQSTEAAVADVQDQMNRAFERGNEEAKVLLRWDELRRRRERIDASGQTAIDKDERFAIRQEQFKLACKRT
jgi:hypothetical protein